MKILVVSLLRLGDLIQQQALLRGLRAQHPQAEIHILVNRQFAQVENILGSIVDRYIYFERDAIQKGLGEAEYNILWSYSQLAELVHRLNQESYDLTLNLTHNKLSAFLIGALEVRNKRGLYHQDGRFQGLSNRWLRYFNDRFSGTQRSLFQYVEILGKAFGIPHEVAQRPFSSGVKSKLLLMQCLTSDSKKNWGLEKFAQLKRTIETSLVDYKVRVLGAPFEKDILGRTFAEDDLLICDLAEVRQHLQNAALLVTGDTSVKHLAAQVGTPIVEISLGSSDGSKTAAFSKQSVVLTSAVPCAPCVHSQRCPQQSHLCAEDVTVERVFEAVWNQLSHEKIVEQDMAKAFDRSVWTLFLDRDPGKGELDYQSALESVMRLSTHQDRSKTLQKWIEVGALYRDWFQQITKSVPERSVFLAGRHFQSSDISELILCAQNILKSKVDTWGYFQPFIEALLSRYAQPVQILERVQTALADIDELLTVRETFARHLQTLSTEGAYYAKGIGKLPITGFEEAGAGLQRNFENSGLQSGSREDATP